MKESISCSHFSELLISTDLLYSKQFLWIISNINVLKTKANLIDSSMDYRREREFLIMMHWQAFQNKDCLTVM